MAFATVTKRESELAFTPTSAVTPAEKAAFGFNYTAMQALNGVFNIDTPKERR